MLHGANWGLSRCDTQTVHFSLYSIISTSPHIASVHLHPWCNPWGPWVWGDRGSCQGPPRSVQEAGGHFWKEWEDSPADWVWGNCLQLKRSYSSQLDCKEIMILSHALEFCTRVWYVNQKLCFFTFCRKWKIPFILIQGGTFVSFQLTSQRTDTLTWICCHVSFFFFFFLAS